MEIGIGLIGVLKKPLLVRIKAHVTAIGVKLQVVRLFNHELRLIDCALRFHGQKAGPLIVSPD